MTPNQSEGQHLAVRINPVSAAVAIAVGSLTITGAAYADTFSEEMVVTATRRAISTQDVPYNIAAFSGETLERHQIEDLNQFARWVPGLTVVDQGQRSANTLTVRGLTGSSVDSAESISNNGGDTVATYLGEVPLYIDLRLVDIERVEVLMGPQGTLYGAGTLGGAVRYIPAKPRTDETTIEVRGKGYGVGFSDDVGYSGDVIFNVPIVSDRLAVRGNIGISEIPGFIDYNNLIRNPGGQGVGNPGSNPEPDRNDPADVAANLTTKEDANDGSILSGRVALLWNIGESGELTVSYNYQDMDIGGKQANNNSAFDTGDYVSGYRFLEPNARENQLAAAKLIWNFEFAELTSTVAYSKFDESGHRDQTDLLLNLGYTYPDFPEFAAFTTDLEDETALTLESRLVSNNDGRLNWIGGVFYRDLDNFQDSREFTPGFPEWLGIAPLPDGDLEFHDQLKQRLTEVAIFGEVGYQFFDRWQATLGTRFYDYEATVSEKTDLPLIGAFGSWENPPPAEDDGVLFKFNTSLDIDDFMPATGMAYLTISEGYRVGGVNPLPACVPSQQQNVCVLPEEQFFKPDETLNYEVGLKTTWLEQRLQTDFAFYLIDWTDVQLQSITINGDSPITVNASDAQSIGFEFAGRFQLNDHWAFYGAYAYNETELTEDAPNSVGVRTDPESAQVNLPADAFDGDRLPGTPENQGSFNVNYTRDIFQDMTLAIDYGFTSTSDVLTKTGLRGRNQLDGTQTLQDTSGEALGGFTLHNLALTFAKDTWSAMLYAQNVFDKLAVTGVRRDPDYLDKRGEPLPPAGQGAGIYTGGNEFTLRQYHHNVIRPRTIGIDFRYFFDIG